MMRSPLLVVWLLAALACSVSALKAHTGRRSDPGDWKKAAAYANEVSDLSDKIHTQQMRVQRLHNQHNDAARYYDAKIENMKTQIEIRKRMSDSHPDLESDAYKTDQESHYQSLMCSMMMEGWVLDGGKEKKLKVLHICIGRTDLALLEDAGQHVNATPASSLESNLPHAAHVWSGNMTEPPMLEANMTQAAQELGADIANLLVFEGHLEQDTSLSASQHQTGPESMHARLQQLETEEKAVWAEMQADKKRWTQEVEALEAEERALGDQHTGHYEDKSAIKRDAMHKVQQEMCSVVMASYSVNDEAITRHVLKNC